MNSEGFISDVGILGCFLVRPVQMLFSVIELWRFSGNMMEWFVGGGEGFGVGELLMARFKR